MKAKTSYIMVGLFVLGLGTAFIAGILWLGSGGPGRNYELYLVYTTDSVSGLSRDGAVKYRGVDVGRVRDISLDPKNLARVRLLLEIDEGTPIKEDTAATLETQGLTGLAYINLLGGSEDAADLTAKEGEPYPVIESRPSLLRRLDSSLSELIDNLIDASNRLKTLLSEENQRLLSQTLSHLEAISGNLAERSDTINQSLDDLAGTLKNARSASTRLPNFIEDLRSSARALERMADEIGKTGVSVREVVEARDRDLQRFTADALPEAAVMINELRQTAENFRQLSEALARDPSVLLHGKTPPAPGPGE